MQWIAPHLRNEKGPIATCYPYASFSYPFHSSFARRTEIHRENYRLLEQRSTHKIRVLLSHCITLFELRSKFHHRVFAFIFIRSLSCFFTKLTIIHRLRFTFSVCNRNTSGVRSSYKTFSIIYLGYSKHWTSNKGKKIKETDISGASTRAVSRGGNSRQSDSRQLAIASNIRCKNVLFGMVTERDTNG